jgi:hypothetical protein
MKNEVEMSGYEHPAGDTEQSYRETASTVVEPGTFRNVTTLLLGRLSECRLVQKKKLASDWINSLTNILEIMMLCVNYLYSRPAKRRSDEAPSLVPRVW